MKKFLLKNWATKGNLLSYINDLDFNELEKTPLEVTIKNFVKLDKEETTRAAQNRLRWLWITDIADKLGYSKDECNQFCKVRFLLPIFVRDSQEWAYTMAAIRQLKIEGLNDEAKHIHDFVTDGKRLSFIEATVSQGAEFLREIQLFAHEQGWTLRTDNDYYEDAMR
jgi:hypothetical protein